MLPKRSPRRALGNSQISDTSQSDCVMQGLHGACAGVGPDVGSDVGPSVSSAMGAGVGFLVGSAVGSAVGPGVGPRVGAKVSAMTTESAVCMVASEFTMLALPC